MNFIPYSCQTLDVADEAAVLEVLRSDWLTQGPSVPAFESAVATYSGSSQAIAVSSATAALHMACLVLGVGSGDRAWTTPNTFVASANCVRYCGATVDFVDIDPETYNMSMSALAEKLSLAEKNGTLPKVVIPVHFAGQPVDLASLWNLATRYGFQIIEDASHALGAQYQGETIGNSRYSQMTVFSFHPVKMITTGEGGMILTQNEALAEKLRELRSHGITKDPNKMAANADPWLYEQQHLGFNYRMTDIQAALGTSQMKKLDQFLECRRALAKRYDRALSKPEFQHITMPIQSPDTCSSYHLYPVLLPDQNRRRKAFDRLRHANIGVNVHYIPVHTQPDYQALDFRWGDFPNAEAYYHRTLSIPLYPTLSEADQDRVLDVLRSC